MTTMRRTETRTNPGVASRTLARARTLNERVRDRLDHIIVTGQLGPVSDRETGRRTGART